MAACLNFLENAVTAGSGLQLASIGVLGTGHVGGTLGRRWLEAGHDVAFGSRDPQSARVQQFAATLQQPARIVSWQAAAADAEVVVLATPWPAARTVVEACAPWSGKILIDCTNPLNADFSGLDLGFTESAAERIAAWAPEARVVKAFNTVSAATMADPRYGEHQASLFFCGDDDDAKQLVAVLAAQLGFDPLDAGDLTLARYLEPFAMLYIHLAIHRGLGANCAFHMLRRPKPSP